MPAFAKPAVLCARRPATFGTAYAWFFGSAAGGLADLDFRVSYFQGLACQSTVNHTSGVRGYSFCGANRMVAPARVAGKYSVPPTSDSASFNSSSSVSML